MVRLLAWLRFTMLWAEPPSSAQITCLICIPGLHDPWRCKDRWWLDPDSPGKSRVAQFQSTALGIQAQGMTICLDNDFNHCRSLLVFLPLVTPIEAFLPLCLAGQWGFLTLNLKLLQPGSIFVAGGKGPCVYLLILVSYASLSAGKLISGRYLSH